MKYYIIAGEASGDLHGSNLIRNLKKIDKEAHFRGFGGDLMKEAGADLAMHYTEMSFAGIMEVLKNLRTIRKVMNFCRQDMIRYKPDALILIDYPGFNLKMARFAKQEGIRTLYYIAPKIWASRKHRIRKMRDVIDRLYVILPFEEEYFRNLRCEAHFLGNPLTDAIRNFKTIDEQSFRKEHNLSDKPVIALLPGSRKFEIRMCLPEMLKACARMKDYQLVLAGASSVPPEYYQTIIAETSVKLIYNKTYDVLSMARAAVVTSGTATLETALFRVPEVVFYKVGLLTYIIGRPFFRLKFFSLVNIVMGQEVVKEFLQFRLAARIRTEITKLLSDQTYRQRMLGKYDELAALIGTPGTSERISRSMYDYLTSEL